MRSLGFFFWNSYESTTASSLLSLSYQYIWFIKFFHLHLDLLISFIHFVFFVLLFHVIFYCFEFLLLIYCFLTFYEVIPSLLLLYYHYHFFPPASCPWLFATDMCWRIVVNIIYIITDTRHLLNTHKHTHTHTHGAMPFSACVCVCTGLLPII